MTLPPVPAPATAPTTRPIRPSQRVSFEAGAADIITTPDGKVAAMLWDGVTVVRTDDLDRVVQLQAERVILFTPLNSLEELGEAEQLKRVGQVVTAAYLEGDVRILYTPTISGRNEQRLRADRAYYELEIDRAVLTDAVIHTMEPQRQIPLVIRADTIRQLSEGEYKADNVELTTSSFAVPSYSIKSDKAYVRQYDTGDPRYGNRTVFSAHGNTFRAYNVPFFYWPWASGSMTEQGSALREILLGSGRGFGPSVRTRWGLFETLGKIPPEDLDVSFTADYFGDRGPAGGIDADYKGGFITDTSKQPWSFIGDFRSYVVNDHGEDRLGHNRRRVDPEDDLRYRFLWEHQHFFPSDWQLQLRAGVVSDPTFLEEWFQREFNDGLPHDLSINLKRQRQSEAVVIAGNIQPNDFVTNAGMLQEQFEVERYPELGYYRIGDSFWNDQFTFFSANTASALHFQQSDASYADMGFRGAIDPFPPGLPAGLPSIGTTGLTDDTVYRGDFRQEINYPFSAGQFRVVPYVVGRVTAYSDTPNGSDETRLYAGTGLRLSTAFWRTDDTASSDFLDIHRLRHVIEPTINLHTGISTTDREDVFIYDEQVDGINDISALQLAVNQRWQTKRGGAGRWRSVDVFTLNTELNLFLNQPDDDDLRPTMFRGLYFPTHPEASVPRNSVNIDALWRLSDSTAVFYDMQYNLDELMLATTSVGLAAQRDQRLAYFVGARYIGELNSTIASLAASYDLTPKYSFRVSQSFNLSQRRNENSSFTLVRKFDRFYMTFAFFYDAVEDESGFRFGLYPEGLGYGLTSDQFQSAIGADGR